METRLISMLNVLVESGKMHENEEKEIIESVSYLFHKKQSYLNVGDKYLDMTIMAALGVGSDRLYLAKQERKWFILDANKNIINT